MVQMILTLGMLAASALASPLLAIPQGTFSQPFGTEMTWVGEVFPGVNYSITGEIQEVYSKILAINPGYTRTSGTSLKRDVEKRNKKDNGWCGNFVAGLVSNSRNNACYLNTLKGANGNPAMCVVQPKTCIRMACSGSTGAYLCNDNSGVITPNCDYLASYLADINLSCYDGSSQPGWLSGQEFDTDSYNVIVAAANCSAPSTVQPSRSGPIEPQKTCNGAPGCIQTAAPLKC